MALAVTLSVAEQLKAICPMAVNYRYIIHLGTGTKEHLQVTAPLFSSRLFEYGKEVDDLEAPASLDVGKKSANFSKKCLTGI